MQDQEVLGGFGVCAQKHRDLMQEPIDEASDSHFLIASGQN